MKFLEIMKLWTLVNTLKAINQIKTSGSYIFDRYFKANAKPVMGTTATIKIKKSASIVLETIAAGADRLVKDLDDVYELTITLPRFGLSEKILAHEINMYESLEDKEKVEAVSQKIADIYKEHKNDYMTTIEYMATGALFGKVVDGKGKVLLEFNTTASPIQCKNKDFDTILEEIDTQLVEELGTEVPYEILCSKEFMTKIAKKAKDEDLFKNGGPASWKEEKGKRILIVHGKRYVPFRATWKDENGNAKPFIEKNKAVVIPDTAKVFEVVYGRADHTQAMKTAPKMFFAAQPEELPRGKGWVIETETKVIPYCVRPGALIKLNFAD